MDNPNKRKPKRNPIYPPLVFGTGKTVCTKEFPKQYTEQEVLNLLENYDRELKLDTFAYTQPCTYTVAEWFNKNKKNQP